MGPGRMGLGDGQPKGRDFLDLSLVGRQCSQVPSCPPKKAFILPTPPHPVGCLPALAQPLATPRAVSIVGTGS